MLSRLLDIGMRYSGAQPRDTNHINRLPAELLGLVFIHLPLSDRIRASLVSKSWREIALNHAELWCDLDNVKMPALPHFLDRTKKAAVRLAIHAPPDPTLPFPSKHIAPHIGHIASLDLRFPYHTKPWLARTLAYLLAQPAHILETLVIVLEGFHKIFIPFPLFNGIAPRLHTLHLEGVDLGAPSAATANVTSFRGPGILRRTRGRTMYAAYTTTWASMFPALRELHLSALTETQLLCTPEYNFPAHLTTLVLEFTVEAQPRVFEEPFKLLELANFAQLRELTLVNAHPLLVARVLRHVESAVSLSLLGAGGADDGAHVRLTTPAGAALNFLAVRPRQSLDEALVQRANIFAAVQELHIDDGTLYAFRPSTLQHISLSARDIGTLAVLLRGGDRTRPRPRHDNSAAGILDRYHWGPYALSLRNLRELRLEAREAKVLTDDVAHFIDRALRLRSTALVPRLAILGVEVVDVREQCGISADHLSVLLKEWFVETVYRPQPRTRAKAHTQRADEFLSVRYDYTIA